MAFSLQPHMHSGTAQSPFSQMMNVGQPNPTALVWDVSSGVFDAWHRHQQSMESMTNCIGQLQQAIENTRQAYNQVLQERDQLRQRLVSAENNLSDVHRVIQRYTAVQDPVVASDGFTYERQVIQQYLDDCTEAGIEAYSQQTKEVLDGNLIPNQSLKKLVELLKTVKAQEVPQVAARQPIPPPRDGVPNTITESDETDELHKKDRVLHAHDLEVTLTQQTHDSDSAKGAKSDRDEKDSTRLHPCIRVYGFCNYKDECIFACYPYEACLNHIKGKCRFGGRCKELHVDPNDPKYQNARANRRHQQPQTPQTPTDKKDDRKYTKSGKK